MPFHSYTYRQCDLNLDVISMKLSEGIYKLNKIIYESKGTSPAPHDRIFEQIKCHHP